MKDSVSVLYYQKEKQNYSVFVFEGEVFGKPQNKQQAIERWLRMSSNSGFLITGHAMLFEPSLSFAEREVLPLEGLISKVVTTKIEFSELTLAEIQDYVSTGEPFECAGGFALEGKGGMFIDRLEGCYSNVIGLSLPWLRKTLKEIGFGEY